jgi:hypothetical protein
VKNDQCHVEQKNGAIVRQVVGYDRFEGERAYRQLGEVYQALRLYVNGFQPSIKLQAKRYDGRKVRRIYDAAKTPLQRVLLAKILPTSQEHELLRAAQVLDPLRLFHHLQTLQQALLSFRTSTSPDAHVMHNEIAAELAPESGEQEREGNRHQMRGAAQMRGNETSRTRSEQQAGPRRENRQAASQRLGSLQTEKQGAQGFDSCPGERRQKA